MITNVSNGCGKLGTIAQLAGIGINTLERNLLVFGKIENVQTK
jgi:hypothetical protein